MSAFEKRIRQNVKTLKDYLKDEIEYINASGEFEDKKALDKKIGEIHGSVDIFIKDVVLVEHKKAIDKEKAIYDEIRSRVRRENLMEKRNHES